jgi:hypothetical protein
MKRLTLITASCVALACACGTSDSSSGSRGATKNRDTVASPLEEVRSSPMLEQLKIGVEVEQNMHCGEIQNLKQEDVEVNNQYTVTKFSGNISCSTGNGSGDEGESGVFIRFSGTLGDGYHMFESITFSYAG